MQLVISQMKSAAYFLEKGAVNLSSVNLAVSAASLPIPVRTLASSYAPCSACIISGRTTTHTKAGHESVSYVTATGRLELVAEKREVRREYFRRMDG